MFLNPLLLFGTLAIGVPIIIHLLNRRKFQRVRWAAMRFVQVSVEKNRRRMRIEDLLLLLVRCLIVLLLALALARPALRQAAALFGRPPVTAMILLDTSASMGKSDGTQTRFAAAQAAADNIIANLPGGSSTGLILFSDTTQDILPQPTSDLALAREKVRQVALSDHSTNILTALQRAQQALAAAQGVNKQIYLVTDGQALGWNRNAGPASDAAASQPASAGNGEILRLLESTKSQIPTSITLVGDDDAQNLSVSNVRLTTELPTVNKVLRFEVDVRNDGNAQVRDIPVRLFVDDAAAPADEAVIDTIPPHAAKSISLHARLRTDGFHGITARIAADTLPSDDARSIVVHALKQVQVLLVDGTAGLEGREEDEFFVREALQPVALDLRPRYFIQTRTVAATELPQTSLDSYDAVVLANVTSVPRSTVGALQKFLADGRGLIVFPGPNVSASFYNDTLYRDMGILPAALGEAVGDSNQGERFETLQSTHFSHPIMEIWNEEGRGSPSVAHFFRMFELRVDGAATRPSGGNSATGNIGGTRDATPGPAAVVASYENGRPAIVEHTYGDGRVILFGSTANTQWNDLPVRASVFIPLMHRVLDSILERQDEHLAVQVGQRFAMRTSLDALGKQAQIVRVPTPGEPVALAAVASAPSDAVRVEMQGNWPMVTYAQTDAAGVYKVTVEGGDEPTLFAVQRDPAESDLTPLSPAELTQLNAVAPITSWKAGGNGVAQPMAVAEVGRELWWPLAAALLAVAAAESLLAFWFSRVK